MLFSMKLTESSRREIQTLRGRIGASKTALSNRQVPLERIKKKQIKRWQTNFSSEGSNGYGSWPRLAQSTLDDRFYLGYPEGPILVRSGRLLGWVNNKNQAGRVSAQSVHWRYHTSGAKDGSYAVFHSTGYFNVRTGFPVPARRIWDIDETDREAARHQMDVWVDSIVKRYYT